MKKHTKTIAIDAALHKDVKVFSAQSGMDISTFCEMCIKNYLTNEKNN